MTQWLRGWLILALLAVIVSGCQRSRKPYIGKWESSDEEGHQVICKFLPNGEMTVRVTDEESSRFQRGTYQIDTRSEPTRIEMKLKDRDPVYSHIERIDNKHLSLDNLAFEEAEELRFREKKVIFELQKNYY